MSKCVQSPPYCSGGECVPCQVEAELPLETLKDTLDKAAGDAIVQAINRFDGNKADAARALGIGRKTIYNLIHRLGLASQLIERKAGGANETR